MMNFLKESSAEVFKKGQPKYAEVLQNVRKYSAIFDISQQERHIEYIGVVGEIQFWKMTLEWSCRTPIMRK